MDPGFRARKGSRWKSSAFLGGRDHSGAAASLDIKVKETESRNFIMQVCVKAYAKLKRKMKLDL